MVGGLLSPIGTWKETDWIELWMEDGTRLAKNFGGFSTHKNQPGLTWLHGGGKFLLLCIRRDNNLDLCTWVTYCHPYLRLCNSFAGGLLGDNMSTKNGYIK